MKTHLKRALVALTAGLLSCSLLATSAEAVVSELSLGGSFTYNGSGDGFASLTEVFVKSEPKGVFAVYPEGQNVGATTFVFGIQSDGSEYSGGGTFTLPGHIITLSKLSLVDISVSTGLLLEGLAFINTPGLLPTGSPNFILTIDSVSHDEGGGSFSATIAFQDATAQVPDHGATLMLLGATMCALFVVRRAVVSI